MNGFYLTFGKRWVDIVASALALLVLSPLLVVIAILIKLEDGGSVLFVQSRVGAAEKPFNVFKFRSMPENTADIPSGQAGGVTITRMGRFIRRTNIDELPQIFNILLGDMSIVGPRPALSAQTALLQLRRENGAIALKPGLTGMAQVNSFDDMPDTEKAAFDGRYCQDLSFFLDVKIILSTFVYLLKPPPVY